MRVNRIRIAVLVAASCLVGIPTVSAQSREQNKTDAQQPKQSELEWALKRWKAYGVDGFVVKRRTPSRVDRYITFSSTAPTYVVLTVNDPDSGVRRIVLENGVWFKCWQELNGFGGPQPLERIRYPILEVHYVEDMLARENQPLPWSIKEITACLVKAGLHGPDETTARSFLDQQTIKKPLTLATLEVNSKTGLLKRYFDYKTGLRHGTLKREFWDHYNRELGLVALLLDLGLVVGRDQNPPVLWISTPD